MGRPRKRITELKLSGMYEKHGERRLWNTQTPCVLDEYPAPGRYLKRTQTAWHEFFQVKMIQGILSIEDRTYVVMMFDALDMYYRISDKLEQYWKSSCLDDYLNDWKDRAKGKDLLVMRSKCLEDFNKIARLFGLTQAERTKIVQVEKKEPSDLMKILMEARK